MTFVLALSGLGLLLAGGFALRLAVPALGRLLLPVPLLAGLLGLAAGPHGLGLVPADVLAVWSAAPAALITLVFAALYLGAPVPSFRAVAGDALPLARFSMVTALGQYVVGFLVTALVLTPVFGVSPLFGCLIEVGFSGGHGTASAMTAVFDGLGFPAGGPLGQMSATIGLIAGVLGGLALIQWGVARGHASAIGDASVSLPDAARRPVPPEARRPVALGTVPAAMIEPLALHLAVLSLAVLAGWALWSGLRAMGPAFDGFPLFPMAMIGGMFVQAAADRTGLAAWLDRGSFERLMGLSLDLLVTAAVASMRLDLVAQYLLPFAILMAAAVAWVIATFLWLAPRMLPRAWFEQAIVVYGTQTGVAAVGLLLLRVVDPDGRTPAARAFAARSIVTSPLVGGGFVTAAMPPLVAGAGVWPVLAATTAVVLACWLWPSPRITA
ncbi:MAG: hypothetical protein R2745_00715 [Vicinamibacterales bacterium]